MTAPYLNAGKNPFTASGDSGSFTLAGTTTWNSGDSTFSVNGTWSSLTWNTCAQEVIGRFEVKDGAGLFCSSNSALTRRVEFIIDTTGEQPIGRLRAVGMTSSQLYQANMNLFAEAPLPETITVGSLQTFCLTLDDQGWKVIYKHPTLGDRVFLKIETSNFLTFASSSVYTDLMNVNVNNYAGFTSTSSTKLAGLIVNVVGVKGNPYPKLSGSMPNYVDDFDRAALNPYNPSIATFTASSGGGYVGPAGSGPVSWVELDGSGNLLIRAVVASRVLLAATTTPANAPSASDMSASYIRLVYDSGKPALYLGGVARHVYFNSTIDAGVVHSITVETNGTK